MYTMYLITEIKEKFQVACERCVQRGYISKKCPTCNGKGIHNKTFSIWRVKNEPIKIQKIDRCSKDEFYKDVIQTQYENELRYWTDLSCFYNERDKLVHFTQKDADRECKRRNIEKFGKEFYEQYIYEKL